MKDYERYRIDTKPAPEIHSVPSRFRVKVRRHRLALLLLKEFLHCASPVIKRSLSIRDAIHIWLSRPCIYGVFSGPFGGFVPQERLCVGCMRCIVQYPEIIHSVAPNTQRALGDSYFTPEHIEHILYEAETGRIPVKGAGYRGKLGGEGWDGMWTDMSEIVRPTRDGIHGREFISTAVDIGTKPSYLALDAQQSPIISDLLHTILIPIPFLFDVPPVHVASRALLTIFAEAAQQTKTLAVMRLTDILAHSIKGPHIVPLVVPDERVRLRELTFTPSMIELEGFDEAVYQECKNRFPQSIVCLRLSFPAKNILEYISIGISVFHPVANYHGRDCDGNFVQAMIRETHKILVEAKIRDQVTLIGSGGIIAAEHVAKAILCGLDAVALDTVLFAALQARFIGECISYYTSRFELPKKNFTVEWGVARLKNLLASWQDQLFEVLGAMGLRDVRRMRGETGRGMFQEDLEREAFSEVDGYENKRE